MVEFLKQWGTLILATTALVQPWLIGLYRRFFRRGTIDIFNTGTIEIGYSDFGPTLGLHGTLRARHRELFVRVVSVDVEREVDHARHRFEWAAFRAVRMVISRPTEVAVALPAGFMLMTTQPFRYNIIFNDAILQQGTIAPILERVRTAWLAALGHALGGPLSTNPTQAAAQVTQASGAAYPAFQASHVHVNAFTELGQHFYWTPGWYRLTLEVRTANPELVFPRSWRFELTQQQSQALRGNALRMVQGACGQYFGEYVFAYAAYQAPD